MLSIPHLIIIFIVALAVLGPEKLPQVARTLGKAMAEFRRVTGDFRYQVESEMREMDRQAQLKEQTNTIAAGNASGTIPAAAPTAQEMAEESAYTAALNLSAPHAAGSEPRESTEPPASAEPAEANHAESERSSEPAPAESQKLSNAHP